MCEATRDTLTVKEIQQILKIGTNSAYNLIHSKAFPVLQGTQRSLLRLDGTPFRREELRPNLQYIF